MDIIEKANKVYQNNFDNKVWLGRCIFLSWYCDLGTCDFCFRSTQKHKIKHAGKAKRSIFSIITEAILAKNLGWRLEFITGGYGIYPFKEIKEITRIVSEVFQEKIWINLGVLKPEEIEQLEPYLEGIASSIETAEPNLHKKVCPDKPIEPYEQMFEKTKLKKSITIVIGLGEKKEDIEHVFKLIEKHKLSRITYYALRPVRETPYKKGPDSNYYVWWIAETRIKFPKIEIIAGTGEQRLEEISLLLKAGANAITKIPATRIFNTEKGKLIEEQVKMAGRTFTSTLTKIPNINWDAEVERLNIPHSIKQKTKVKLKEYLRMMTS
jgi:biotin synthase-like enzyme